MFGRKLSGIGFVATCASLATLAGCASVDVTRISDANRESAKGFRYYLPRPYLVVKQPFTVAGEEFLVRGTLKNDNSVEIDTASLPASALDALGHPSSGAVRIDRTRIAASDAVRQSLGELQSSADPAPKPDKPAEDDSDPDAGGETGGKETETSAEAGTTKGLLQTAGDPATDPRVDLQNPLFDIIYLPDFEEQYAVRVRGGLGEGSLQLGLENGWMVERASAQVDNTELGKFIYRNIDKATDLAIGAAKLAIGLPPAVATPGPGEEQSSGDRSVLLRIKVLTEAQPGTYPFLKLSETTSDFAMNQRSGPAAAARYVHLACPPDTRVSYNAVRRISIELVSLEPQGSSPSPSTADPSVTANVNIAFGSVPQLVALAGSFHDCRVAGKNLVLIVKKQDTEGLSGLRETLENDSVRDAFLKELHKHPNLTGINAIQVEAR